MAWLVFAGWEVNRWRCWKQDGIFHALSSFHKSSCFCFSLPVTLPVKNCYVMLTWNSRNPKSGMNLNEFFLPWSLALKITITWLLPAALLISRQTMPILQATAVRVMVLPHRRDSCHWLLSHRLLVSIVHRSDNNWQIRGYLEEEVYRIHRTSFHITSYSPNENKGNNININLSWDWENKVQAHNPVVVNVLNKVYKQLQR